MTPPPSLLEVRELQVRRGDAQVLDVPGLALKPGEVLALIGPNGSGKSTLLLALAGLLEPAAGTLSFRGAALRTRQDREAYRRRMSMVFQESLLFDATVRQNLEIGLKWRGIPSAERRRVAEESARRFGIEGLLERPARGLSGGEAQRTSLARAFALHPDLIFLDEPFSSLDPPTREALLTDLAHTLRDTGTTALLATHDQAEALRLADRLAVMRGGRIVQLGTTGEVMNHPTDAFVASYVGMETLLDGVVCGAAKGVLALSVGEQEVSVVGEAPLGHRVLVGIRPEHVTLSLHADPESSARNAFHSVVTKVTPSGPVFRLELDCGFFLSTYVTARSMEDLGLVPGREVVASFKATAAHLIRQEKPLSRM